MYTGLPLMPAMTPVLASGPPSSRARMRLRFGPMTLRITPRISTLKSSSLVPGEHGSADADHARAQVFERHVGHLGERRHGQDADGQDGGDKGS